ncbi:NAD-dependent epimerase/dehydratase family protein [Candidatus Peregrinibacteria bacterium]|nr:NAD-dependent epimerase/dehydratase family protein [Candidatus Peregrinibacteria bacterium]
MNIFLTGATGYIGSAVAEKLKADGHHIIGLARSKESSIRLQEMGIEVHTGDLCDSESIIAGVSKSDGVIHTAAAKGSDRERLDKIAVKAILKGLDGYGKTFIYTSGSMIYGDTGDVIVDEDSPLRSNPIMEWRIPVEEDVLASVKRNIRSIIIRPVTVYGGRGNRILPKLVKLARENGAAKYIDNGDIRWTTIHLGDLAELYFLALEKAQGGTLFNASSNHSMTTKEFAEAIAKAAGIPGKVTSWTFEDAKHTLGAFANRLNMNLQLSSAKATKLLGWTSKQHSILDEISKLTCIS